MAQAHENPFNPSSPHSSNGGVESFKGTPDTRLTAFSPDEGSSKSSKFVKAFPRSASATPPVKLPIYSHRDTTAQLDKDPFVTPTHNTRLSPTASSFKPVINLGDFYLTQNGQHVATALSSELGISHHLDLSSPTPLSVAEVDEFLLDLVEKGIQLHSTRQLVVDEGHVYMHFSDIRDACSVCSEILLSRPHWKVSYLDPCQVLKHSLDYPEEKLRYLGQVTVFATLPQTSAVDAIRAVQIVQNALTSYGHLFAFRRQASCADGSFNAIAQFCSPSDAVVAVSNLNGVVIEGIHLVVTPPNKKPTSLYDLAGAFQNSSLTKVSDGEDAQNASSRQGPNFSELRAYPTYPMMIQSPLHSAAPYLDRVSHVSQINHLAPLMPHFPIVGHIYQTPPSPALTAHHDFSPSRAAAGYARIDARRQNANRLTRSPYHSAASNHNHVDIGRIRDGIDVRTTIMLRNIPNKVDQAMLKRIIDESSWGKYDFMYLRIDFANDCNVGYAFINFVDPLDIIDFVNARGNQRWNCFKSDKIAEISYATIQGKDCLVQKFRNSSVMLEAPHYRPKLYFTSNGPVPELAGQEETFPEPDNQSKMKRSCENAEHVGLFTPNAGQHFRDEQRRRRSQYDRGTRLAALEEYDLETAIQQLYGPAAQ